MRKHLHTIEMVWHLDGIISRCAKFLCTGRFQRSREAHNVYCNSTKADQCANASNDPSFESVPEHDRQSRRLSYASPSYTEFPDSLDEKVVETQEAPVPPRTFEPQAPEDNNTEFMIKQLDTRPISQEQIEAEVKGIYAGILMFESKCIEFDNAQYSKLNDEQWKAFIALHRTLLHEHHDFFLVSQHPSASPTLRQLASKYDMPARMGRHGIHSFLELLRRHLPASLEYMLSFIQLAYPIIALLYETVPMFEGIWIDYLRDLARERMAIKDDPEIDRAWKSVYRHWCSKACLNALKQSLCYAKSLCALNYSRNSSAYHRIMTLKSAVSELMLRHSQSPDHA
ncbi:hypothetical protein LZ31DRAFT_636908 [Colletotrichum somersetense]|nr:hypothetical protein LZ31DRAFT_636908 [Colletotrichum somersetense]